MKKVAILQHRLLHYRMNLFNQLRGVCAERGIELHLVHGQASLREQAKKDEGNLSWAYRMHNRYWAVGDRDIIWQPFPAVLKDAELVVLIQENRILSNYPLLLSRLWSRRKIAFWGHGVNYQSDAPSGWRERWKGFLLTRVDWWFAYTDITVNLLKKASYPHNQITCLNNVIDTNSFKMDLASWSTAEISTERERLGIEINAPVGIYCGSLYPNRRLDLLIAAADLIRQKVPNFALVVIGDGPSMPELRDAAGSRPWIHLLGVKKEREKALYFSMGDVMLNPGVVGLNIVDAFCSGLAMITTTNAGHGPEFGYLRNGINGMATDVSPDAFSRAVLEIITNPELLAKMKQAALSDSERYTLDNMVKRFADGIEEAVRD